jgi:hypothetical protein
MQSIGLITNIGPISNGPKPQMGPTHTVPFVIEVQTTGGQGPIELTQDAAVELMKQLGIYLRLRGKSAGTGESDDPHSG